MHVFRVASLAALAFTTACVSDSYGYAPQYPPGYDSGMGSGNYDQPGDLFGGQNVADIRVFYEPLAPYGVWTQSQFGYAFQPRVDTNWRPYVNGQWGENRLWLSNDPWGWATDHYGRWGYDQRIGWVWVPGTEWAPSWVAWREDDRQDVAGWAPVPPGVAYSFGVGFGSALAYNAWNDWYAPSWVWVPRRNLYAPGFGGAVLPWRYGQNYWRGSHWNHQPGWNGRPGYAQPGYGNRPPNWNGNGRPPNWNGNRPPDWSGNGRPPRDDWASRPGNVDARPPGGQWQGRPPQGGQWQGRPPQDGGQVQGRPPQGGGQWQGRPPQGGGQWQGRPPRNDVAGTPSQGRPPGGRPPPGTTNGGYAGTPGTPPNAGGRPPGARPAQPAGAPAYVSAPPPPRAPSRPPPQSTAQQRDSAASGNERPQ
jgi:hypothetical protein